MQGGGDTSLSLRPVSSGSQRTNTAAGRRVRRGPTACMQSVPNGFREGAGGRKSHLGHREEGGRQPPRLDYRYDTAGMERPIRAPKACGHQTSSRVRGRGAPALGSPPGPGRRRFCVAGCTVCTSPGRHERATHSSWTWGHCKESAAFSRRRSGGGARVGMARGRAGPEALACSPTVHIPARSPAPASLSRIHFPLSSCLRCLWFLVLCLPFSSVLPWPSPAALSCSCSALTGGQACPLQAHCADLGALMACVIHFLTPLMYARVLANTRGGRHLMPFDYIGSIKYFLFGVITKRRAS